MTINLNLGNSMTFFLCVCRKTNLNKVTCNLREGLDISKLSTTGADFELIPNDDPYIEDEKEAEHYQQNLMENLNPECADFCDEEGDKNSDDDDMASVSVCFLLCFQCRIRIMRCVLTDSICHDI